MLTKKKRKYIILSLLFFLPCYFTLSYPNSYNRIGLIGSEYIQTFSFLSYNFENEDFVPNCCLKFNSNFGFNNSFKIHYKFFLQSFLSININSGLKYSEYDLINEKYSLINVGGEAFNGKIEHLLQFRSNSFFIEPGLDYWLSSAFYINASLGLNFLYNTRYLTHEKIIEPSDRGVFNETGTRTRELHSGNFEKNKLYSDISIKIGAMLPLTKNSNIFINPSIGFGSSINSILNENKLNSLNINLSLGISYALGSIITNEYTILGQHSYKPPEISISAFSIKDAQFTIAKNIPVYMYIDSIIYPYNNELVNIRSSIDTIRFNTILTTATEIKEWKIELLSNDSLVHNIIGTKKIPILHYININTLNLGSFSELQYTLSVTDIYNNTTISEPGYITFADEVEVFKRKFIIIDSIETIDFNKINELIKTIDNKIEILAYFTNCENCIRIINNFENKLNTQIKKVPFIDSFLNFNEIDFELLIIIINVE